MTKLPLNHLKLTPQCHSFFPQQAVRDDISVPERSYNTPSPVRADTRRQPSSSAPSVSTLLFFSSWKCPPTEFCTESWELKTPSRLKFRLVYIHSNNVDQFFVTIILIKMMMICLKSFNPRTSLHPPTYSTSQWVTKTRH